MAKSLIHFDEIFGCDLNKPCLPSSWSETIPLAGSFVVALRIGSTDQCGVDNWSHVRQKDSRATDARCFWVLCIRLWSGFHFYHALEGLAKIFTSLIQLQMSTEVRNWDVVANALEAAGATSS